jgi:D-glycero-alpha-D-manno-heptose 1-phosphate guanylyltransferase
MPADLSNITAAILAGGKGTRLRGAVSDRPKVLAEVAGRPFITYLLDQLADAGVREVVLCTGYMAEMLPAALGEYRGVRLTYSAEESPLDTGGAILLARAHLKSDPYLVLNGDSYCATDLAAFHASHLASGLNASIVLAEVPDVSRFGRVLLDVQDRITRFDEKGAATGRGWINAGVYLFQQDFLKQIPPGRVSLEHTIFPASTGRMHGYRNPTGAFIDIGTEESYSAAAAFFARRV